MTRPAHGTPPIALLLALLLTPSACSRSSAPTVIRLGHGLDTTHPVHRAMTFMAERVEAESGGDLRLEIYPSEQLGSERECLELLQIGSLGMTKVSASVLENFAPTFEVFGLPYLFRDRRHLFSVLEGPIGQELLLAPQSYRLRGLAFYDAGSRSFYTRERQVKTPQDLRGLKIRTQESPTAMRMVQAMGASATPIAWGELYTALQQGVVDGAENNPPSFYLSRHYEVCKYYTLDEHSTVPDVLLIGTETWSSLTIDQQQILQRAATESAILQQKIWQESSEEALAAVAAAGVIVVRPDKSAFATMVLPMLESYRDEPSMAGLIERIRQTPDGPSAPRSEAEVPP